MSKSLSKNVVFNFIYQSTNVVFPLLSSIYVARVLGAEAIGSTAYAQNVSSYFVAIASSGISTYGIREISRRANSQKETSKAFGELFIINLFLTAVVFAAYVFLVLYQKILVKNEILSFCYTLPIIFNFINVDWFYMGKEEYQYITCRNLIIKILFFLGLIFIVKSKDDVIRYALLSCLALGVNHVFNIINLKKYHLSISHEMRITAHLSPVFILSLNSFLDTLYSKTDITMLGLFGNDANVGNYTYAQKIPNIIATMCIALTAAFFPRLSYYYNNEKEKFIKLVNGGVELIMFISIPAACGYAICAPEIVNILYGAEFYDSILMSRLFAIMIIIKSIGNLLGFQVVICTGNEKKRIPAYIFAAIFNISLNYILIPSIGGIGAIIASIICELFVNIYLIIMIKSQVRISFNYCEFTKVFVGTAVMVFVCIIVGSIHTSEVLLLIMKVFAGVITYSLMSYLQKNVAMLKIIDKSKIFIKQKIGL